MSKVCRGALKSRLAPFQKASGAEEKVQEVVQELPEKVWLKDH
jgi:hypothetical protein